MEAKLIGELAVTEPWQSIDKLDKRYRQEPPKFAGAEHDSALVDALLQGDEKAFTELVDRYCNSMIRVALLFVRDQTVADEVVQDTWLAVLKGLGQFERRSSLRTWMFRILTNQAKTRAKREGRTIPFSALAGEPHDRQSPSVDPSRFRPPDDPDWPGHWARGAAPASWADAPEERLLSKEIRIYIQEAIDALPPAQREIILLRDVEGWTSQEVCNALDISETNQRVLLHRARSKTRQALENYLK